MIPFKNQNLASTLKVNKIKIKKQIKVINRMVAICSNSSSCLKLMTKETTKKKKTRMQHLQKTFLLQILFLSTHLNLKTSLKLSIQSEL